MLKSLVNFDVAIVGAGLSGISFAVALKRQLPNASFTIIEKAGDLGGTWRDNIYPGCASDARIHVYSLSTEQNPDWDHTHAYGPDILAYWRNVAHKHNLIPHVQYHSYVQGAEWNAQDQFWTVQVVNVQTGTWDVLRAKVVISAIGALEIPSTPDIPGLSDFKGEQFHSARWKTHVNFAGKKVAVIGNGASAAQFVPLISQDESVETTQFCRSPKWYWSVSRGTITPRTKWIFRHVPFAQCIYRAYWFFFSEVFWAMFSLDQERTRNLITKYMKETVPDKYHSQMIPDFPVGCKRTVFDVGYLRSLHQPNIHLNFDKIERVTEGGIVTSKGDHLPFDIIIFATGFVVHRYPIAIKGSEDKTVQEYYDSVGGAQAYRATTLPGFPNFFMMLGPNVATGHASAVFGAEVQTAYILQLIRPILSTSSSITSVAPTHAATESYNARLQAWLTKSVWTGCQSWYRQDGSGKILSVFPGPMMLYWWWMRSPIWSDYVVMKKGVKRGRWYEGVVASRLMAFVVLLVSAVVVWRVW